MDKGRSGFVFNPRYGAALLVYNETENKKKLTEIYLKQSFWKVAVETLKEEASVKDTIDILKKLQAIPPDFLSEKNPFKSMLIRKAISKSKTKKSSSQGGGGGGK